MIKVVIMEHISKCEYRREYLKDLKKWFELNYDWDLITISNIESKIKLENQEIKKYKKWLNELEVMKGGESYE